MNIHGWKFVKKEKWIIQKDQVKRKKMVLKKKWSWKKKEKKSRSAIWALLCKVSGLDVIWKEKLCSTSL